MTNESKKKSGEVFRQTLNNFFRKVWIRHALLVTVILLVWQAGAWRLRSKAHSEAIQILQPRYDNIQLEKDGASRLSNLDTVSIQKLQHLLSILENRKEEKKKAFLNLYPYHFASSTFLLILSSLSVVVVFIVAQEGVNKAKPHVRTLFFSIAALTSFYAISPLVYKLDSNISKNLSSYIHYDNLQGKIYNYAITTHPVITRCDSLNLDIFHGKIIDDMLRINSIDFEFDYKVIPIPDFNLNSKLPG